MNSSSTFNYFFRKSPLLRTLLWILFAALFTFISLFISKKLKSLPEIKELTPPVGSPGDIVIINGHGFGNSKDSSCVDFGGNNLTASSYILWSDEQIKIVLPPDFQDGLVSVKTKNGRSNPAFFANANAAPVAVMPDKSSILPVITSFSPESPVIGGEFIIYGTNFGTIRDKSQVFFSIQRGENRLQRNENDKSGMESKENLRFIPCNEDDFDYEYWSDNEIRVRIPDGAVAGEAYVQTAKGKSPEIFVKVSGKAGVKAFILPKTYLIQTAVDIDDASTDKDSSIILRCPYPYVTAAQPLIQLTNSKYEPVIENYQHSTIYQVRKDNVKEEKKRFSEDFMIYVYETRTEISAAKLGKRDGINAELYEYATRADECVPSDDEAVHDLLKKIIGNEKNAYNIAALVYNYMTENFTVRGDIRRGKISPIDLIDKKHGDAYDFAMIFTALLRAAGIPALPDSGILIGADMKAQNHWWCEFYLSEFGWVPADPALGAGLDYQLWRKDTDVRKYYFGNLDAQHILFSRGWNEIKPSSPQNKTATRQRTFALQEIWEEALGTNIKYSSYWADPGVLGVY
ncbi:MAG: transglutaminase domain-containing protein [Treponema sp.]